VSDFSGGDAIDEILERLSERLDASIRHMVFRHLEEEFGDVNPRLLQSLVRRVWFYCISIN